MALLKAGIPVRYSTARVKDFGDKPPYVNNGDEESLYLWGQNGTGKTHFACALIRKICKLDPYGNLIPAAEFVSSHTIMVKLRDSFRGRNGPSEGEIIDEYSRAPLLVIDDLGSENRSDFTLSSIFIILENRVNSMKRTIITSNLSPKEWRDIDKRIASRLRGDFRIVEMGGADRRLVTPVAGALPPITSVDAKCASSDVQAPPSTP